MGRTGSILRDKCWRKKFDMILFPRKRWKKTDRLVKDDDEAILSSQSHELDR